jgi:hypothetical protein
MLKSFNGFINENNDSPITEEELEIVEKYLTGKFSHEATPVLIQSGPGGNYPHFSLLISGGLLIDDIKRYIVKLTPEVEKHFNRVDDQGLEPLVCSNKYTKGEYGLRLSYGEIDLKSSELFKSLKTVNKYDL